MAKDTCSYGVVKGYKVTNGLRKKLIGVACSSLEELKIKGCKKLQIETDIKKVDVLLNDGTVVEDENYFSTIPSQTVLILRKPGENILRGMDIMYDALKSLNSDLLQSADQVRRFFTDDDAQKKIRILSRFLSGEKRTQKTLLSHRAEDPEWFEDLETLAKTKEAYMRMRSNGRIQRYFYDAKSKIQNSSSYYEGVDARKQLNAIVNEFYNRLKKDEFFACLFDRKDVERGAICDKYGMFTCQGLWNYDKCLYLTNDEESSHRINPYRSKEDRVVFTTWNLDHRIERSRSIVPAILQASQICCQDKRYKINSSYFYDLLFTPKNLKLVHIVCHDKCEHKTAVCNYQEIIMKTERRDTKKKKKYKPAITVSVEQIQLKRPKRTLKVHH